MTVEDAPAETAFVDDGNGSDAEPGEEAVGRVDAEEGPSTGHVEAERTFTVPDGWAFPSLKGVGAVARAKRAKRFSQTATYFDTLDLDLLRARRTLRRRVGGHDAGWHLKTPRPDGSRLELGEPLGSSAVRIPRPFLDELADIAASKALVPVAVLRTDRTERALVDDEGRPLALVADDTVEASVRLLGERGYRWRELEVELVEGEPALLDELVEALLASGLEVSPSQSKLGRALQDVRRELEQPRDLRAGDVLQRYVAAQVAALQWLEAEVRAEQPEAVHKARVATRRLRSALRTFRPLLERAVTDPLRDEVRWVTGLLGAPRDAQVLQARFEATTGEVEPDRVDAASLRELRDHLQTQHDQAHAALVVGLDSERYERLLAALMDLLVDPPWRPAASEPAAQVVPRLVRRAAKVVSRAVVVAEQADDPQERDEALHEIRKRIKAARYAVEAGADIVRKAPQRIEAWTALQDALGDYQDSVVARDVLEEVRGEISRSGGDPSALGVLGEREAASAATVLGNLDEVLHAIRAAAKRKVRAQR